MTESPFPPLDITDQAKCPKCGARTKTVVWHDERRTSLKTEDTYGARACLRITEGYHLPADNKHVVWVPEHMHRRCDQCSFQWAEAPLA